jgi:hypothetical protein
MNFKVLKEVGAHYVLSVLTVFAICSVPPTLLGLPAPFFKSFFWVGLPMSFLVSIFSNKAWRLVPLQTVWYRVFRLVFGFSLIVTFCFLVIGALAFYIPFLRAMFVWQMLTSLIAASAAVMTWRMFQGTKENFLPMVAGFFVFSVTLAVAIALTKHFAVTGWIITGVPRV